MATKETPTTTTDDGWSDVGSGMGTQWDFDKSGDLVGTYVGSIVKATDDPNNIGSKRDNNAHKFDVDGQPYFVWGSFAIDEAFTAQDDHANLIINLGDEVRIQFLGKSTIGGGRTLKNYRVQVRHV